MAKINENGDQWIVEPEPVTFPATVPAEAEPVKVPEPVPVG